MVKGKLSSWYDAVCSASNLATWSGQTCVFVCSMVAGSTDEKRPLVLAIQDLLITGTLFAAGTHMLTFSNSNGLMQKVSMAGKFITG